MKRRQLIKNLGLGGVALVATPTVLSLLQSCKSEPVFNTVFLDKAQGRALRHIVDLIIPSDEAIPGAVDLGVHEFIDMYWNDALIEENKAQVPLGFNALADRLLDTTGKTFENADADDFDVILAKYLKITPEQEKAHQEKLMAFYRSYENDKTLTPDPDAGAYSLLTDIRGMTIWGWKNTEKIGEEVLAYAPIPGQQKGCISVEEATGGKAYSL